MRASAVRCRACGSRLPVFQSLRKPQARFGWRCPPRMRAAGGYSAKAGRCIAPRCLSEVHENVRAVTRWIGRRERLSDVDAFTARILLIHYYRRVVLRDPLLRRLYCLRTGPAGQPASSAARFIAGCFPRPNNGLTGTGPTKMGRYLLPAKRWRAGSTTRLCYKIS